MTDDRSRGQIVLLAKMFKQLNQHCHLCGGKRLKGGAAVIGRVNKLDTDAGLIQMRVLPPSAFAGVPSGKSMGNHLNTCAIGIDDVMATDFVVWVLKV